MTSESLAPAVLESTIRQMGVADLIRAAEALKHQQQASAVAALYQRWIDLHPDEPLLYAVLFNHAVVLSDAGQTEAARTILERALALNPDFIPAHVNLGRVHERQGRMGAALEIWSAALAKMAPVTGTTVAHKTMVLNQSARVLEAVNRDDAAETMLQQSLDLDVHQHEVIQHLLALRQRQCEWPVVLPTERATREALMQGISPLSIAALTDDPILHLATASHYNKQDVGTPPRCLADWPRARGQGGPLRIGYLSSDLREHAVGYLMTEVLGLHDRKNVEVFAYYCGPESHDSLHAHFQATADHWVDLANLDDEAACQRMVDDGIQILVDLNGYTREARLKLVARRPAPVIVNWLGFPGTMASPYHHYIIADDWIIPDTHELYYSEKVLRLPCYQPSSRKRVVACPAPSRKEAQLPENAVVYCCFNGLHKVTKATMDRWLLILRAVPDSVLWLMSGPPTTEQRLRAYAAEQGVAQQRLIFAEKLANPAHLARYPLADLFLDTTPYGAHTTASDALWMGLPVLTWSGRSFASRVCGSLVRAAGLPEMVTHTASDFVERAVTLGRTPAMLASLRDRLRTVREASTLFDTPGLVRRLEELYQRMWRDFRNGERPRPDLGNLDVYLEVGSQVNHEDVEVQSLEDYHGWWRQRLAERDRFRPIAPDQRLLRSFGWR